MANTDEAVALFYDRDASVVLNAIRMAPPGDGMVTVRALHSAVSRGTERLVLTGRVPASEHARMRCPHQAGEFSFPVKYGYANVGVIEAGPGQGETVFCLHPHQSRYRVPSADVVRVPSDVPPRRAALAANLETATTVLWDAGVSIGDRVVVVGAGVVGLLVARLATRVPGTTVTVVDTDPAKRTVVERMGVRFAEPDALSDDADVAINASATPPGLVTALGAVGPEATVVEASWLGTQAANLPLGGAFHARRLTLRSSQVGTIPPSRSPRWSHRRRLELALALAADDALDALLTHEVPLDEAPDRLPHLILNEPSALAITLRYEN